MPPCKFYKGHGYGCHHGDTCLYVHISPQKLSEYRKSSDTLKWYEKPCKLFDNGHCPRGEKCTFIHRTNQRRCFPIETGNEKPFQKKEQGCSDDFERRLQEYKRDFHTHMESRHLIGLGDRSTDGTIGTYQATHPQPTVEHCETNKLDGKKSHYTTLLKPTIHWQTKEQITRHGLKNANGKLLGKRKRSSSVELDPHSKKIKPSSTLGLDAITDVKRPPFKKAKPYIVACATETHEDLCESKLEKKNIASLAISIDTKKYKNPLDEDFYGFNELARMGNDLTKVALNTTIIMMQNKYEEDCSEFAQHYYEVVDHEDHLSNNNSITAKNFNSEQEAVQLKMSNDNIIGIVHPMKTRKEDTQVPGRTQFDDFSAISSVQCCQCLAEYPAFFVGLIQDYKGHPNWRCKDCASCVGCSKNDCSLRMTGGPMMMCSICGDHFHVEDQVNGSDNTFFCKVCGDFADSLLTVDFNM